jgi:hypothetical protein
MHESAYVTRIGELYNKNTKRRTFSSDRSTVFMTTEKRLIAVNRVTTENIFAIPTWTPKIPQSLPIKK